MANIPIALAGQNEIQGAIQGAYDKYLEDGVSPDGVNGVAGTSGVTNDKGLTVESVSKNGQTGLKTVDFHTIGAPDIAEGEVKSHLLNVVQTFNDEIIIDGEVERVQEETGNASQEAAMKRTSEQRKNSQKKFTFELVQIKKKVNDMPNKTEAGEALSKAGKVFGSFLSVAGSAAFTVFSGGGGTPALVAACMGFASTIADVSGGYKAMEEKIADSLAENGKTRADAERAAAFISMGLQFAVEIASTVVSCKAPPDPRQKVADAINDVKKIDKLANVAENPKVVEAATEAATKLFGPNPTKEQVKTVIEQAEKIAKADEIRKWADSSLKIVMLGVDVGFQADSIVKSDKSREHEADLNLSQVDSEQVLSVLAECGQNLEKINRRNSRNAGKIQKLLVSASDSIAQINEIGGGMA